MAALNGYLALGTLTAAGVFTEITGATGYARQAVSLEEVGRDKAQNANAIAFTKARNSFWPTFNAIALYSSQSGGAPARAWTTREPYPDELYGPQPMAVPARGLDVPLEFVTAGPSGARSLVELLGEASRGVYRLKDTNTLKIKAALAKSRAGNSRTRGVFIGDSTVAGQGAGSGATAFTTGMRQKSLPNFLAKMLSTPALPWTTSNLFGAANLTGDDTLVFGADWTLNGAYFRNATSTTPATWTPGVTCDRLEISYITSSAFGTLTVTVDGALIDTISQAGGTAVVKKAYTLTSGTHTIVFARSTGGLANLLTAEVWDSTKPDVALWNLGRPGTTTTNWMDASSVFAYRNAFKALAPDFGFIKLGTNDASTNALVSTKANLAALIADIRLTGDAFLLSPPPSTHTTQDRLDTLHRFYLELSEELDVPLFDMDVRGISYETAQAQGFMSDTVHRTAPGYADEAAFMARPLSFL